MRMLTVLSVSYPLACVSQDSAGGAEQILATLDSALVAAGHRSLVIAPQGSVVAGSLHAIPQRVGILDKIAKYAAQADTRSAMDNVFKQGGVDVVHMHGIDFISYLPPPGVPLLVTLHLPCDWYPAAALRPTRPDMWLHCVSDAQHALCPPSPALLPPIANGVAVEALGAPYAKRRFALLLGRICPEKGTHLGIEAARRADLPLLIAGQIYPYVEHLRYFEEQIRPHLGAHCRFLGPVGFARKRRLLTAARCLLIPSLVAETSSLVAREAAACGTPVIAFPQGALRDTVEQGRTGFLVDDVPSMASAILACGVVDPNTCRAVALARFSERPMIEAYIALYQRLAKQPA